MLDLRWLVILIGITLVGCMLGPDFKSPRVPSVSRYTNSLPAATQKASSDDAGKAQFFVMGKEINPLWWQEFGSSELNQLVAIAIKNNPNLSAQKAALMAAQENYNAALGANFYPAVNGALSGTRQRFSTISLGGGNNTLIFNLFNANINVAYTFDIFGGLRRSLEALGAQVDYSLYEWQAAYLTLTANVVSTAITKASLETQIIATQQLVNDQASILKLTENQFRLGGAAKSNVLLQQNQLEVTRAALSPLKTRLASATHTLHILLGRLPTEGSLPAIRLEKIHLPAKLSLSLPAKLVSHRPDIKAAESLLHAASAQIGVAKANLFPQISASGNYGYQNNTISSLFSAQNVVWSFGANLAQPIFNGGALRAKYRAAYDNYENAKALYQQTVLAGFQNAADILKALQYDAEQLKAFVVAEKAAFDSWVLTQDQFKLGSTSFLNLLISEQIYRTAYLSRIQTMTSRYIDTVSLYVALGGAVINKTPCREKI